MSIVSIIAIKLSRTHRVQKDIKHLQILLKLTGEYAIGSTRINIPNCCYHKMIYCYIDNINVN